MTKLGYQRCQALLALLSLVVLLGSFYFQYFKKLEPCPLCLMQRLSVFLLLAICFTGTAVRSLKAAKIIAFLQFFVAAGGLFFAGRQLWLQSLPPDKLTSCLPELDILIRYFPLQDVFHSLFWGSKDCAAVNWSWLGLPMPAWVALYFLVMLIAVIPIYWLLRNQQRLFKS